MPLRELDSENADRDLTSLVTVLTHTPDASNPTLCVGCISLGDGTKDLDGTGGDFELVITVGGQTVEPSPHIVESSTAVRTQFWTGIFPVPTGAEVVMRVKSPNSADSDVDVIAQLFEAASSDEVHLIKQAIVPTKRTETVATGVHVIYDTDGSTELATLTPSEAGGVVTVEGS